MVRCFLISSVVASLTVLPAGASPDCGSPETKELALKIAKETSPNKLLQYIVSNSTQFRAMANATPLMITLNCNQIVSIYSESTVSQVQFQVMLCKNFIRNLNQAYDKSTYSIDTIRMTDKDAQTEKVVCAAKLSLDMPDWGGAKMDVTFQVENTTDGQLYVTVNDLQ
jgi:hypothetical protein